MIDKQIIRDFLMTLVGKDIKFGDDDSLLTNQLIDSLNVANLIVFLQETFKVTFENDDLTPENLDTVNAISGFLEKQLTLVPENQE
jgi:acyl carrier protein